jgi:hypothetical protein
LFTGSRGTVFTSLSGAPQAVARSMPVVRDYLRSEHADAWPVEFVICHNGGRAILQAVADELSSQRTTCATRTRVCANGAT